MSDNGDNVEWRDFLDLLGDGRDSVLLSYDDTFDGDDSTEDDTSDGDASDGDASDGNASDGDASDDDSDADSLAASKTGKLLNGIRSIATQYVS